MVELLIVGEIFVSFVFSFGMEAPLCLLSHKRKKNVKSKAPSPLSTEEAFFVKSPSTVLDILTNPFWNIK